MLGREEGNAEDARLSDYVAFLRRRFRTALGVCAGFMAVAFFWNGSLPEVYESSARVVIGSATRGFFSDTTNPIESYLFERRSFETQLEVIASEPVATLAAIDLGWVAEDAPLEARQHAAGQVRGALSVRHLRDTRIAVIAARDSNPARARNVANAVARAYIAFSQQEGQEARLRSAAWLTEELDEIRGRLRTRSEELVAAPPAVSAAPGQAARGQSERLTTALGAAELDLVELLQRYREGHPRVVEARARVARLRGKAAPRVAEADQDAATRARLLQRDIELDHEMYDVLLKKLKEIDVSGSIGEANLRILESARMSSAPIAPRTTRNLAVALLLSLCAAVATAFCIDNLDRSVGTPEEIRRFLGLPTLGVVTRLAQHSGRAGATGTSPGGEMFRTLRTNLRFSHVDAPRRVVLVTSAGPAEGKSTVIANLGRSLAASGRRTLLIDTDLRKPSLHRAFEVGRTPGLVDVLAGDASVTDALRTTETDGLALLTCGPRPANPAELIESRKLQELVAQLRESFDYVLLDSPPSGGLIDASLLSVLADGVIFVVEPRRFDSRILRGALRQLERGGARIYGAVLNKAERDDNASVYGYYEYGEPAEVVAAPVSTP